MFNKSEAAVDPADPLGNNGFFSAVGKLLCHNIGGFLPEDSEEKDVCRFYLHIGSFGP
jgi:hypothetical protein